MSPFTGTVVKVEAINVLHDIHSLNGIPANATYTLSVKGCAADPLLTITVEGGLLLTVAHYNATAGWNGTVQVLGPGTILVNASAAYHSVPGGQDSNASSSLSLTKLLPLLVAGGAAVAAAAGILLYRRHRQRPRTPSDPTLRSYLPSVKSSSKPTSR
ncbi:MAG: hypothetical protein L3K07_08735 [Thermoplasmata archaeon]|nr:hypothetical protein [Thermoplasmata archaeon]